jgi:hypothetical protein
MVKMRHTILPPAWDPEGLKWQKGWTPTFKNGPGSAINTLSHKTIKSAESLGSHAFEGAGDISLGKNSKKNMRSLNPWIFIKNYEGPIPLCEGDAFRGFDPHQL